MKLDYTVKFSDRKTLRISVERDKSIVVTAPNGFSLEKIHHAVERKKLWIYQKRKHEQKYNETLFEENKIRSGSSVTYLGKTYTLHAVKDEFDGILFDGKFYISKRALPIADQLLTDWLKAKAREYIIPKTNAFAASLGVEYKNIRISEMRYRWGTCSKKNNLNFNWRLIKAPLNVIDYVIVHEAAHILESGHGKDFWQIIKIQLPHFQAAKDWLKDNGEILEN